MQPIALATAAIKALHHRLNDDFVTVTSFMEKEFDIDDHSALTAVYDRWHSHPLGLHIDLLMAIDQFIELFESGEDNFGEREDVIYELMEALKAQFLRDYHLLRIGFGEFDELLTNKGALKPEIWTEFEAAVGPVKDLSDAQLKSIYSEALAASEFNENADPNPLDKQTNPHQASPDSTPKGAGQTLHEKQLAYFVRQLSSNERVF